MGESFSSILPKIRNSIRLPPPQLTLPEPLPRSYDPNAYCEYHRGYGHITDRCLLALRHTIQDSIEKNVIVVKSEQAQGQNILQQPLPPHNPPTTFAPSTGVNLIHAPTMLTDPSQLIRAVTTSFAPIMPGFIDSRTPIEWGHRPGLLWKS